jgi:glutathione S-transferase
MRLRGYALPMSPHVKSYVERVAAASGVAAWISDALAEHDYVPEDEPYRNPDRSLR